MDETFQLRATRLLGDARPAPLDFALLSAVLRARQTASPAARAQALSERRRLADAEPLVETLSAGPGWREAAALLGGCFSRAEAGRRLKVP